MRQITLIFRAVSCSRVWNAFVSHLDLLSLFGLGPTVMCHVTYNHVTKNPVVGKFIRFG